MERAEEAGSGVEIGAGAQDVGRIGAGIGEVNSVSPWDSLQ
jgi:hypothetical protein